MQGGTRVLFNHMVDNLFRAIILNHMVESRENELGHIFHALSDPTRRRMLSRLADGSMSVTELAGPFDMSLAAVSKHITVLEWAGLVSRRRRGRTHQLSLRPETLRTAAEWLEHYSVFWEARLDALGRYLTNNEGEE